MILTSPSAQLPAEQEAYRAERQTANAGGSASDAAAAGALMRLKWSVAANPAMWDEYAAALHAARGARWLPIVKPPPTPDSPLWKDLRAQLATDARPAMRRVLVPTLILFGATDDQVPPRASADGCRALLDESGNRDAQITEIPNVGHGIFTARLDGGAAVVPEPRALIARWLSSHQLIQ
jgi:alpha-beta hydrolase superfamily lysophospholipase